MPAAVPADAHRDVSAVPVEAEVEPAPDQPAHEGDHRRPPRVHPPHVDHLRVVLRHVDDFGAGRQDLHRVVVDDHLLLGGGLEVAGVDGLLPQPLDGIHHILLLIEERRPQRLRPVDVLSQHRQHRGVVGHRLHRRVPRLDVDELVARLRMRRQPLLGLNHVQRVRRGRQHLRQQRVGIQGDGGEQLVELVGRQQRGRLFRRHGRGGVGVRVLLVLLGRAHARQ